MKTFILTIVWLIITVLAFSVPLFIDPTGTGFTRGTNRLPLIMALHGLAFLVALFSAGSSYRARSETKGWLVALGFVPLGLELLFVILIVLVLLGAVASGV
ncbi:hypothetical protein QUF63_01720 [Anaerolineales bacterium HSG25]|nr:hypothetical protein [Anaerolineales bacterium HSG25]